ncbi:hypothetical protein PoB_004431700 [Plakobranchus ocellatus]|uniref:Uncharacterized protein n=1 Tax=Plakobranchus ocellatus TaxID=259542 RepID=A0AAV4BEE8_9GAST|nr:hypothetical protein PoB_004431700 [Plakobranchus ocellatus]
MSHTAIPRDLLPGKTYPTRRTSSNQVYGNPARVALFQPQLLYSSFLSLVKVIVYSPAFVALIRPDVSSPALCLYSSFMSIVQHVWLYSSTRGSNPVPTFLYQLSVSSPAPVALIQPQFL